MDFCDKTFTIKAWQYSHLICFRLVKIIHILSAGSKHSWCPFMQSAFFVPLLKIWKLEKKAFFSKGIKNQEKDSGLSLLNKIQIKCGKRQQTHGVPYALTLHNGRQSHLSRSIGPAPRPSKSFLHLNCCQDHRHLTQFRTAFAIGSPLTNLQYWVMTSLCDVTSCEITAMPWCCKFLRSVFTGLFLASPVMTSPVEDSEAGRWSILMFGEAFMAFANKRGPASTAMEFRTNTSPRSSFFAYC